MSKKMKAFCLACCLFTLTPALADYSDLQASTSDVSVQTVTVSVYNPTASAISARVRVPVTLDDDTFYMLTGTTFTVAAGATISVALTAPAAVVALGDDPQQF